MILDRGEQMRWTLNTAICGVFALATGSANAAALSTPAMSGPLAANPNPISFDAGPLGSIYVGGTVSGLAFWQDNHVPGDQEPAISRGVQANYSSGPLSLALSWNDGFYSNRLNWISGSAAYTIDSSNTVSFIAGGNTGHTGYSSFTTPLAQNNGDIFNLI